MNEIIVPKIYVCGDKEKFLERIGQRPFKLLGLLNFFGDERNFMEDKKFLLDDKLCELDEIKNILAGADFLVFMDAMQLKVVYSTIQSADIDPKKLVTWRYFKSLPLDNFYDTESELRLMQFMKFPPIRTVLDVDAHFLKSPMLSKSINDITEFDCITQEPLPPIKENIYTHIYKNFSECALKHYDAVIINSTSIQDFIADYARFENVSDMLMIYVRNDSDMHKAILERSDLFDRVTMLQNEPGTWLFCYRPKKPQDFAIYTVTHKKMPEELANNLPAGYQIIHAGKAISDDLGYSGDDTGENVSHLNEYINELTAFYWAWRNTNHTIIGMSHYRRFMTVAEDSEEFSLDKILTQEQAENLLERYDVLANMFYGVLTEFEEIVLDYNEDVANAGVAIVEKHLAETQPDYLEAFRYVMSHSNFYRYTIIVTRKNVFDAYCSWLFSFLLKAVDEINRSIEFGDKTKRLASFLGERMFTVWLIKNHLRVKDLLVMQVPNL